MEIITFYNFVAISIASAINCYHGNGAFGYNHLDNKTCPSGVTMCSNTTYGKYSKAT